MHGHAHTQTQICLSKLSDSVPYQVLGRKSVVGQLHSLTFKTSECTVIGPPLNLSYDDRESRNTREINPGSCMPSAGTEATVMMPDGANIFLLTQALAGQLLASCWLEVQIVS